MTRLLCLTSWYPPHHFGGYELSCHDVMHRLAERGHHVEVLTSDHRHAGVGDGDPAPVAAVHRDLRLYFRDGDLWSPPLRTRLAVERRNQRALTAALDRCRPDVVAVWHVGAMSLGLLRTIEQRGIPMVHAVSDDWPTYCERLDPWTRAVRRVPGLERVAEALLRVPSRRPRLDDTGAFCFISEVTRERCRRLSPWAFPRSTIVYSGIDGRRFGPGEGERGSAVRWDGSEPLRLLFVGRVDPRKGIETVVRALALLPEATLVVDGRAGSAEEEALARWTAAAGVADRVTVRCSDRASLPEAYRHAHVCVFASEWEEPFGLVPLEAMACGTPVVATGVGGSGEFLVDGGNCVRFEPGSAASLADAVRRLAGDPDLRERVVANGRATAAFFDVDHLADAFEAWYDAAAAGFSTLPPRRQPPPAPALSGPSLAPGGDAAAR